MHQKILIFDEVMDFLKCRIFEGPKNGPVKIYRSIKKLWRHLGTFGKKWQFLWGISPNINRLKSRIMDLYEKLVRHIHMQNIMLIVKKRVWRPENNYHFRYDVISYEFGPMWGRFQICLGYSREKYGKIRVWCIFMQKSLAISKTLLRKMVGKGCFGLFC